MRDILYTYYENLSRKFEGLMLGLEGRRIFISWVNTQVVLSYFTYYEIVTF